MYIKLNCSVYCIKVHFKILFKYHVIIIIITIFYGSTVTSDSYNLFLDLFHIDCNMKTQKDKLVESFHVYSSNFY